MDFRLIILIFILIQARGYARDATGTRFIQRFIDNEHKPTFLISNGLCWNKNAKIAFSKEVMKSGIRLSTSIESRSEHQDHNLLFLLDMNCPGAKDVIILASSRQLFRSPYRWLILTNSSASSNLEALWNSPVLADSDVVLAVKTGDHFKLIELHKPSPNGSMVSTPRGYYNGKLVDVRPHRELFRRRRDVMGHPLTMSNVIQDSNSTRFHLPREDGLLTAVGKVTAFDIVVNLGDVTRELQHDAIAKICWMNARLAFNMLNATPRYIFSYRWGYKVNGQWSGMINDLHSNRAELGTNCVVSDQARLSVVAYTDTLAPFRVRFVFRQPPLPYVTNIYSLSFSVGVWVAIAACAVVSTLTLYLACKWDVKFENDASSTQLGSITDAMFLTMCAVSQQGCAMEPRGTPGRMMGWVVFTALMALYAAYSASIVVLLQAPSNSIRNLGQLAESKVTLAANDVDYNHFVFKFYKDPVHVAIYKRIEPEKGKAQFYNIDEGVERIRQGLFAFHSIVEPLYRRIEKTFLEGEKCDLTEIDYYLNRFYPSVPVKKNSPYLELLRVAFKKIRESGIQSCLNRRYQVPKPRCASKAAAFSSVGLLDMRPVLLLMLYGILVSVAILQLEIILFRLKKRWSPRVGES